MVLLAFAGSPIQLVPDGTLLLHLALVVLMVGLLNVTLLKPINRILEERERRTRGRVTEAQTILGSVSAKMREYEARLREARSRGYTLLEEERTSASLARERRVSAVKAEVAGWLEEEKSALQIDEGRVRANLENAAQTRALEIGRQILGRSVRPVEHR